MARASRSVSLCVGFLVVALNVPAMDSRVGPTATPAAPSVPDPSEDVVVFTAHQGFLSRIYLLRMDGSVLTYFEYENYFLADLEVVNNEVYIGEAFAPRVLRVDLQTGDLYVVVDDWSLYYFYGVAFDGNYWYVDEWDLNRYEFDGAKVGTASFDESVAGSAWDGTYLWTMSDDENVIKCWDISQWPDVTELLENRFTPPTADCRGLWFDGEYFWTTESIDGALGNIYRFDYDGTIIREWLAPAFRGWGVCVVSASPLRLRVEKTALGWNETLGAFGYDVVTGDLRTLRDAGGYFAPSVDRCLADDTSALVLDFVDEPAPGEGCWILVRGVSVSGSMSYDTGTAFQVASRDDGIDAATNSCP